MKKLFTLAAALVLVSATASAQMFATDKVEKVSFGIRAGMNLSNISGQASNDADDKFDFDSRIGFNAGVVVDIPLTNGFYLQPGLLVSTRGCKKTYTQPGYSNEMKINALYLEVPVLASFRFNASKSVNIQANVGPYAGIGISGKVKNKEIEEGQVTSDESGDLFGKGSEEKPAFGVKRFDFGLSFGAGVTIKKHYFIGVKYDLGLLNLAHKDVWGDQAKFRNGNFSVQLGYNF